MKKKKVFIGLSGGVDSSVSATLLKEAGYDVTGVFIKVWSPDWLFDTNNKKIGCTWREDRRDAMRACAHLNIPFITLDLEKEYKQDVVDYMIEGYRKGIVPNPDVMCNKQIKFGSFFDKAMSLGADYVATGHYARIKKDGKKFKLLRGKDNNKDQSYFLWTLTQKHLSHTLFPIGEYKKSRVRELAEKFSLPTAEKKDSQGLCFLGHIDVRKFIEHFIPEKVGDVLNKDGQKIGVHSGAHFFTVGQRHGFTITEKGTADDPYYVVGKDIKKNTITVATKEHKTDFMKTTSVIDNTNWILGDYPGDGEYEAQVRYLQPPESASIRSENGSIHADFKKPQDIAPGQSCVLYNTDECMGGGTFV